MKNNQFTFILVGMLFLSTLGTAALLYYYNKSLHRIQETQANVQVVGNIKGVMQALIGDLAEYSKKNPAIDPLLQSVGVTVDRSAAAAKPAGK